MAKSTCSRCGSENVTVKSADYDTRLQEALKAGGLMGLLLFPATAIVAATDSFKIADCNNCGRRWHA
jgi:transcription elongation factor Elf1